MAQRLRIRKALGSDDPYYASCYHKAGRAIGRIAHFLQRKSGITPSSGNNYKFTGKERDPESGLDDFGARYYSSALGRFASPDWSASPSPVPYANLGNPQTLNLYNYVHNNPLNFTDPSGHETLIGSGHMMFPLAPVAGYSIADFAMMEFFMMANSEAGEQQQQPPTTLTLGGVKVDVTFYGAEFSDGTKGAVIEAYPQGCGDCRWAQTTSRTGEDAHAARTDREAGSGAQPVYPGQPAPRNLVNGFADAPSSHKAGTFTAVTTLGVADRNSKTFKVLGSMTWGYKIDKNGKVTGASPRAATRAEQARSLAVLRRESPTWAIGP